MIDGNGRELPSAALAGGKGQGEAQFPKRFYQHATVARDENGFGVRLDGRAARTPARHPLVFPTLDLAHAVAEEWSSVEGEIDPRRMPFTRLANSVIDGVRLSQASVFAELLRYTSSDLLVYRAGEPARLVQAQKDAWDPIITWSSSTLGAPLILAEGVMFVSQPEHSLRRLADYLSGLIGEGDGAPFRLGALHVMTTLTGSSLLAAATAVGRLSVEEAWAAAHVDEDYQISEWGEDTEAMARRAQRGIEMRTAARVYQLST